MSASMVQKLVVKDWYLLRAPLIGYVGGGLLAVLMLATGGEALFNVGSILIITLLIAFGMHVVMATVVGERIEHTLPFVMSLPVSIAQYTLAKIVANGTLFLTGWLVLSAGVSSVILLRPGVPHGLFVFSAIMLLYMLASYTVLLAVAIVTESMAWTIVTVIIGNLGLNFLMMALSQNASIKNGSSSAQVVWSAPAIDVILCECAVMLAAIAVTFAVQSRKSDFL